MNDPDELAIECSPVHEYPLVNADLAMAFGTAVDVPLFDSPFTVGLPIDSTVTWYRMELIAGQGIEVVLSPHINFGNLDVNLFDCNGTYLNIQVNDIVNGLTNAFAYTAMVGGTYYLRVDRDSGAYGSFDLAVYNAWSNTGVTDNDRDYFSTCKTSRQVDNDNFLLTESDTLYYFRMVANAGDDVVINLTPYIQIGNLDVNFFDRNGNNLKYSNDIGNGVTRTISRKVEVSGVYYIRIDRDGGAYGSYDLSVSDGHEINADSDVNQQSIWYGVKAGSLEYSDRSLVGSFMTTGYSVSAGGVFSSFSTITFDGFGSFKLKQTYNHLSEANQEESGSGTYSVDEDGTFILDYNGEITKGAISEDGLTLVITGVSSIDFHSISFAVRPVDGDNDGVPCSEEMLAPNSGDGNDDNISDCQQNRVASLIGVNDDFCTVDISLSSNGSSLDKLSTTTAEVFGGDSGYNYTCGIGSFIVGNLNPGTSQTVRIYFHGTPDLSGYIYRCYDPATDSWSTLQGTVFGSRNIDGETVAYAEFTLVDGSLFDNDSAVDGVITALGGPALPECALTGDLDGDNDVDGVDFSLFVQSWGWTGIPGDNLADLDKNGVVDSLDCKIFAQRLGGICN